MLSNLKIMGSEGGRVRFSRWDWGVGVRMNLDWEDIRRVRRSDGYSGGTSRQCQFSMFGKGFLFLE